MSRIIATYVFRPSTSISEITTVSVNHADTPGTSETYIVPSNEVVKRMLQDDIITLANGTGSLQIDELDLHYLIRIADPCPLIFCCIVHPSFTYSQAFLYLNHLYNELLSFNQLVMFLPTSGEMELQAHIDPVVRMLIMAESGNASAPSGQNQRVTELRQQVDQVKTVMAANVEAIIERGERLDNIERRTDELQATSANFKLTARRVQRKMCMMNAKWTFIAVVATILFLILIIFLILNAAGVFNKK